MATSFKEQDLSQGMALLEGFRHCRYGADQELPLLVAIISGPVADSHDELIREIKRREPHMRREECFNAAQAAVKRLERQKLAAIPQFFQD